MLVRVKRQYFHVHCGPSFEVKREDWRQTGSPELIPVLLPGLAKLRPAGPLSRALGSEAFQAAEAAMGIPAVPYQAESLAPSGALTGAPGHWPGLLSLNTFQKAFPTPRCTTAEVSGASHWHMHTLEQALSCLARPGKSFTAMSARSSELSVSLLHQSCPSSVVWSLLTTLPVRGPYSWGLLVFFKAWETEINFSKAYFPLNQ